MASAGKASYSVTSNMTVDVSRNTCSDCGSSAENFSLRTAFISASVPLLRYGLSADASYEIKQLSNLYRVRGAAFDILFISSLLGARKANNIAAEK
jgi:hypothetical protein